MPCLVSLLPNILWHFIYHCLVRISFFLSYMFKQLYNLLTPKELQRRHGLLKRCTIHMIFFIIAVNPHGPQNFPKILTYPENSSNVCPGSPFFVKLKGAGLINAIKPDVSIFEVEDRKSVCTGMFVRRQLGDSVGILIHPRFALLVLEIMLRITNKLCQLKSLSPM